MALMTPARSSPGIPGHDRRTDADGDEDGVEALMQLLQGLYLADADAELEVGAQRPQVLDLSVHDLLGKPVSGDPVAEHAPRVLVRVEDGNCMAAHQELPGAGKTSRPRTDDGDRAPGRRGRVDGRPVLARPLRDEALDRANRNNTFGLRPLARAFALVLVLAHTARDGRQWVVLEEHVGCSGEVADGHVLEIARNVDPDRAGGDAGRVLALQAGGCRRLGFLGRHGAVRLSELERHSVNGSWNLVRPLPAP